MKKYCLVCGNACEQAYAPLHRMAALRDSVFNFVRYLMIESASLPRIMLIVLLVMLVAASAHP